MLVMDQGGARAQHQVWRLDELFLPYGQGIDETGGMALEV
ncbi:hypothetical protein FLM9_581 [Candidatus Synechococcus spongiarum]|uniref:Uncharacterized protein n=1 Tax=Candidatus Synechococcus spongiarum TaxID=431041 RepID=A0A161KJL1_9SYNE|nr:hypothetical protein FLM9_581 [Candidatus Synechococcus spongiarum]